MLYHMVAASPIGYPGFKRGYGPAHDGLDETAHMHSLARAFTSCMHKVWEKRKAQTKIRPLVPGIHQLLKEAFAHMS